MARHVCQKATLFRPACACIWGQPFVNRMFEMILTDEQERDIKAALGKLLDLFP